MDLSAPPRQGGFRHRGEVSTRLKTFVDAAFASAVMLLLVSVQAMSHGGTELEAALRRVRGFLAAFATPAIPGSRAPHSIGRHRAVRCHLRESVA